MTETESVKVKAKPKADVEAELADAMAVIEDKQTEIDNLSATLAGITLPANDGLPKTVYQAWSAAMAEVQAISKDSRNQQQNFNFRGIDAVVNAVGPALRRHGLIVVPTAVSETSERYETKSKAQMIGRVVEVEFTVYGPKGDSFTGSAYGEAADSGDKAMAKAHSVALRTFLLQSLTIPTDEQDPDASTYERSAPDRSVTVAQQQPVQQQPAQKAAKSPADEARDELRELAQKNNWDLARVGEVFSQKVKIQGVANPDIRTAPANDIRGFKVALETGAIQL